MGGRYPQSLFQSISFTETKCVRTETALSGGA